MNEGATLGPYVVRRHLGDGGMGSVWLAEDTRLHRRVALKTLKSARTTDTAGRERLMREARAAAAFNHPNIAAVYDVLQLDGDVVIVFEYVDGPTLASALLEGAWPVDRAITAATQLAKALAAAHAHGVVHRDLKPSNVIVGPDGDLKVLDFGIAKLLPQGTTVSMHPHTTFAGFVGTPAYAAPEQLLSPAVDERADLYALGVIVFEMLTGRRPFAGHDAVELASAKLGAPAPALSSGGAPVPPALDALVAKLLERQPADRPASAAQVLTALRAISGETATIAPARSRAHWARWSIAAVVLFAAVIAAIVTVGVPHGERRATDGPKVVAVLPLRNTSGDAQKEFLAAGLSESLIASLASSRSMIVLSRSAVADAIKGDANVAKAIHELGATLVIDGSVQQSGDALRVAINLVRADQSIAWGHTFDGSIERVFDLQTRMALAVAEALSPGSQPSNQPFTTKPAALEAYWRGRAFLDRWDVKGNIDAAIAAFSESIGEDSTFALAHAGLGRAYWLKYGDSHDPQIARLAVASGELASSLDANQPEVLYALAISLDGTGRRDDAIASLKRAIELRPTFDDARRRLAAIWASQGHVDDAIAEFRRAIALRPNYWGGYSDLGLATFRAGRYDEAARAFEQVVRLQPDSYLGFQQLGSIYQMAGQRDKAVAAYQQSIAIRPSYAAYSNLGMLEHTRGHYETAVKAYRDAIALRPKEAALYRNLGDALVRLGRAKEAHETYAQAVSQASADLQINPGNARNMAALAVYLVKAGRGPDAVRTITSAVNIQPDDVQVLYRAAVVYSLAERAPQALTYLAAAIKHGYSLRSIREEEDFAALRPEQEFQRLLGIQRE